jgi:hypothetical protein
MKQQDYFKFVEMMNAVREMHDKQPLGDAAISIYWRTLTEYSYDEVQMAVFQQIRDTESGKFFPKPADIRQILEGNNHAKAIAAWAKLESAFGSCGAYRVPVFDDVLIHYTIDENGGWLSYCHCDEKEYPFKRDAFMKGYKSKIGRTMPVEVPKMQNIQGFPATKVFIGDRKKCETVLLAMTGSANNQKQLEHKGGI